MHTGFTTQRAPSGREDESEQAPGDAEWLRDTHVLVYRTPAWASKNLEMLPPSAHRDATHHCYRSGFVEEIFAALENKGTDRVSDTLKILRHMSLSCLKVNLKYMGPGPSCRSMMP
jgi:hypothetical protein